MHEKLRIFLKDQAYVFEVGGTDYNTLYHNNVKNYLGKLSSDVSDILSLRPLFALFLEQFERKPTYYDILDDFRTKGLDVASFAEEEQHKLFERSEYARNSEYDILENLNYTTNLDIVPLLREDISRESLQDTDLYAYIYRDDPNKSLKRKRNFLEPEMLQMFAYIKAWRNKKQYRSRLYDAAGIVDIQTISPKSIDNGVLNDLSLEYVIDFYEKALDYFQLNPYIYEYLQLDGFYSKHILQESIANANFIDARDPYSLKELDETTKSIHPKHRNFLSKKTRVRASWLTQDERELYDLLISQTPTSSELGMGDSKTSREISIQHLQELVWYRYYYKIDSSINYYDLMPSYQKFYMQTWPSEYLDSKYNYYGKINTIDHLSIGMGKVENGYLIYDDLTDINWYGQYFNNELGFDQLYLYLF
jgi:hypothetical protein